jgi:DNA-binding HxlR family transcriptional regulator
VLGASKVISQRMLTLTLKNLVEDGLLVRRGYLR